MDALVRSGPRYWLRSYVMMLRFDLAGNRRWLPLVAIFQVLMGGGMAIIYGFYYADVAPATAFFIVTGAPALALIPVGFAMVPNLVGEQKLAGTYDFLWSQPVPRMVAAASNFTLFTALALPGTVVALVVAAARYGVNLSVSPAIVPAVLLTALMATSVGFGLAHAIPNPFVTNLISNAVIFLVLLFTPIAFPRENFPAWLADVHDVLPFYNMGVVIRDGLSSDVVTHVGRSYAVLAAWTIGAWVVTAWVVGRRR